MVSLRSASIPRRVELDDIGLVRMLARSKSERKVARLQATLGQVNRADGDALRAASIEGSDRARVPIRAERRARFQRILANDVACKQTALDFSRAPCRSQTVSPHRT
jgi:hypothetical protein